MEYVIEKLDNLDFSQPLSLRNIRLKSKINGKMISKRLMLATLHTFERYKNVSPLEVGSGKYKLNVWTRV